MVFKAKKRSFSKKRRVFKKKRFNKMRKMSIPRPRYDKAVKNTFDYAD